MNKFLISSVLGILFLVQIVCGQTLPGNSGQQTPAKTDESKPNYPNLKTQAEEVCKATVVGDFGKLVDFTYPKIVAELGGKDKMIAFLKTDSAQMKADGFELEAVTVGKIEQIVRIDNQIFAVVPINLKMKFPNGKYIGNSSMVGISDDNGANWKFINGINQDRFREKFPKAAEKIQIPVDRSPQLIESE